jgi:Uri superfamily endonuclease
LNTAIETRPGSYVLWLQLHERKSIRVGSLGLICFEPGIYAYTGSAFGPGGVASRLGRHFRADKKKRWHIDYLRPVGRVTAAWVSYSPQRFEHRWASILGGLAGAVLPVPGFGSSDCRCRSHLIRFARRTPSDVLDKCAQGEAPIVTIIRKCE